MTPEYEDDGDVTVFHHDLGSGSTIDNENGHIVAFDPLVRIMFSNFSFFYRERTE